MVHASMWKAIEDLHWRISLNIGDKILFNMDVMPEVVPIRPEGANGEPKNRLGGTKSFSYHELVPCWEIY